MERLVVFLGVLTVCAGCFTNVKKDFVFGCPAPNNKGLQAVFEEFIEIAEDKPLEILTTSSSMNRIGKLLYGNMEEIAASPEYEKLKQFLCDKAFVDSTTYQDFFWFFVMGISQNNAPAIPDSELREDFLNSTSKLYQSELYRKSQEILYQHIRSDPYAQLGMEYLDSAERRQLLKEVLNLPYIESEVHILSQLGVPVDKAIEVFAYTAVSIWTRKEVKWNWKLWTDKSPTWLPY